MIDTKGLRRLAEEQQWIGRWYDAGCETLMAEMNGEHEEVAHPMPIGLVPYLVAVQPAAIAELLDLLEAVEQDRRTLVFTLGKECAAVDAAKSECLEKSRLLSISREREAALMAKLEAAEKERDALSAPEGWKLVPIDPTPEMVKACASAARAYMQEYGVNSPQVMWAAMLAAAPKPEGE